MLSVICFFFNDTATTEIYTLSLHDALPIYLLGAAGDAGGRDLFVDAVRGVERGHPVGVARGPGGGPLGQQRRHLGRGRSEEHTSELQSRQYLVCRLLLEKKKKKYNIICSHD